MKTFAFATSVAALALATSAADAETLREALAKAYAANPTITAARASQRATDETVPIARSQGLPNVATTGSFNQNVQNSDANGGPVRQATGGVNVAVPIFTGGAVRNSVRAAETRVEAGQAQLRQTESDLFTEVVAAYNDVIRDEAIVSLNRQNVRVLQVNLQAARDRFEVGDLTRTDVAQSQARLSLAEGQLRSAEATLVASRENYIRVVGSPAGELAAPPPLPNLPSDPQAAVQVALETNPSLLAAERQRDATRFDVATARAQRLPRVSVGLGTNYYNYLNSVGSAAALAGFKNSGVSTSVGVNLSLPLFQGGLPAAQIRQAQARRSAAIEQVTAAERAVVAQTRGNFASWQSSLKVIDSAQVAVDANRLSLEGVRAENSVGTRTILDILNAEQELLNSQVTLVSARRNAYVAGFALLASMGKAQAADLGLDGGPLYDPNQNYKRVRGRISDFGEDAEPSALASRTVDTPAQTPEVAPAADPVPDTRPPAVDKRPASPAGKRR